MRNNTFYISILLMSEAQHEVGRPTNDLQVSEVEKPATSRDVRTNSNRRAVGGEKSTHAELCVAKLAPLHRTLKVMVSVDNGASRGKASAQSRT